jgi:hypothetical protein
VTPELVRGVAAVELALSETALPIPVQALEPDPVPISPEPFELAAEDERAVEKAELAPAEAAQSAPVIDMLALEQALDIPDAAFDITAIEQRYPLLRNAL